MTRQEIYDKVKAHLLKQGQRATDGYSCKYRAPGGLKCAVGCLISDETYDPCIEGVVVESLLIDRKYRTSTREERLAQILESERISPDDFGFLSDLQNAHDGCDEVSFERDIKANLSDVANEYQLVP